MDKLRALKLEDAKYMMEFIEDEEISKSFKFTRYPFSIDNFTSFIKNSWDDNKNIHYAIVDDEYAGTVSLKNINYVDGTAEYAIVVRRQFWGTGISQQATSEILNYAFKTLNLRKIYLNVLSSNIRANKFYQKNSFVYEGSFKDHVLINGELEDLNWYCIFNNKEERR